MWAISGSDLGQISPNIWTAPLKPSCNIPISMGIEQFPQTGYQTGIIAIISGNWQEVLKVLVNR